MDEGKDVSKGREGKRGAAEAEGKDTVIYSLFSHRIALVGITNFMISLSALIILPVVTRTLSVDYYGILVQVLVTVSLVPLFANLGLPGAMVRFLAAEKRKRKVQEGVYSILMVVTAPGGLTALLLFILADHISPVLFGGRGDILRIASGAVFFETINSVLFNYFRTFQQIKRYSVFMLAQTLLYMGLLVGALLLRFGLLGATYSVLASRVIVTIVMVVVIGREVGARKVGFSRMREFLGYAVPYIPYDLSDWLLNSSDRYLIGAFLGMAFVGYYSPGYSLSMIVLIVVSPLRFLLPPALSKLYDEGLMDDVRKHLSYSLKYFLIVAVPAAVGLSVLSRPWLEVLTTDDIATTGWMVTPFVSFAMIFYGMSVIGHQVMVLKKKTRLIGSIMLSAAFVNIGINIVVVPMIGIMGAAYSTLVAYMLAFVVIMHYAFKDISFTVDWASMGKSVVAALIMGLVISFLDPHGLLLLILGVLAGIALYAGALVGMRTFSRNEFAFFRNQLKKRM